MGYGKVDWTIEIEIEMDSFRDGVEGVVGVVGVVGW